MRILIASAHLPWPLWSGGNAAQFSTLRCLADDHEFTLVCPVYSRARLAHAQELQRRLPSVRIRAVYCGGPEPSLFSRALRRGGREADRWLQRLRRPPEPASQDAAPAYPFHPLWPAFIRALQEELGRGQDLCQAEFAEMMPLGAWWSADVPKLFVHHQVHFVYADRMLQPGSSSTYGRYLAAAMREQELAFLKRFDAIVVFGEPDRIALAPFVGATRVHVSPFPVPADVGLAHAPPDLEPGRFLFVGSEEHGANHDALAWLLAEIWPRIAKQVASAHLHVIGEWSEAGRAAFRKPAVTFTGFVEDLAAALRSGILLVPLRIGSGIRTKILAALAQGVCVVSTPVGAEGLPIADGRGCLIREDASGFADAAVRLVRESGLRDQVSAAGLTAIARDYSPEAVRHRRNEVYQELRHVAGPPSERQSHDGRGECPDRWARG